MKNKFWMENLKAIIGGAVVGLIVLGLIYWKFFMVEPQPAYGYPPGQGGAGGAGTQHTHHQGAGTPSLSVPTHGYEEKPRI